MIGNTPNYSRQEALDFLNKWLDDFQQEPKFTDPKAKAVLKHVQNWINS